MGAIRASAPIPYTDSTGRQWSIPASSLEIDDSGVIKLKTPTALNKLTTGDREAITNWVTYLLGHGAVTQDTSQSQPVAPAGAPSLVAPQAGGSDPRMSRRQSSTRRA